jgi:hypothetical protein
MSFNKRGEEEGEGEKRRRRRRRRRQIKLYYFARTSTRIGDYK